MGDVLQLHDEHEQAQMLLPWRVNGTLEPGEAAMFDAHLAVCAECREDLAANLALRRLYSGLPAEGEPTRPAMPGRIDPRLGSPDSSSWGSARRKINSGWGRVAQAAVAAAAAVALVLVVTPTDRGEGFRLLGSKSAAETGNAIVLFAPDTAERDLRAALEGAGARLVDGPTASGAYIVRIRESERAGSLERLRALPQVILAEPVDASDGP
jgi:hypothetical protein